MRNFQDEDQSRAVIDEDMEDDEDNEEDMDGKNSCFFLNLYFYSAIFFLDDPLYDNSDGDGEAEHNVSMFEIANGNYDGGNSREGEGELTLSEDACSFEKFIDFLLFLSIPHIHIGSNSPWI